jgi:DNA-binding MarR family transcriptional regulator
LARATPSSPLLEILRDAFVGMVRNDNQDLSARGLAIFLICADGEGDHTVRGLAARMNVSKPSITRSLDRLEQLGLIRRKRDPADGRSVLVGLTPGGASFLRTLRRILATAAQAADSRQAGLRAAG